jgi:riboflavin kinase/FMN adenylyltransferase
LLSQVRHIADERGLKAMAITFGTSPRSVLGRGDCPQLTTADERTTLLRQVGMDEVAVLDFTPQMAAMTARDFMQQVLREQLHVAVLVIGYDHRFGRGRSEGFDDYVRYGQEMGIEVMRGEACIEGGEPVSSTRIRQLLEEGQVDEAAQLLGYRYTLRGKVVGGYREGRKMGFPTANIRIDNRQQTTDEVADCKLLPADGVYAVYVNVDDNDNENVNDNENFHQERYFQFSTLNSQFRKGMLNIGYRPTLNNGKERSIEVHILDFEGDLYGKDITVEFAHRLREERTYANTEELTEQLMRDEKMVRELLSAEE